MLGELSPDAIWVKDGDKIEVQLGKWLILHGWLYNKSVHCKADRYYVKCSNCNTYH